MSMLPVDRRRAGRKFVITLDCGCRFKHSDYPFSPNAKFGCPLGGRHGYNVGWVSWKSDEGGRTIRNPKDC